MYVLYKSLQQVLVIELVQDPITQLLLLFGIECLHQCIIYVTNLMGQPIFINRGEQWLVTVASCIQIIFIFLPMAGMYKAGGNAHGAARYGSLMVYTSLVAVCFQLAILSFKTYHLFKSMRKQQAQEAAARSNDDITLVVNNDQLSKG